MAEERPSKIQRCEKPVADVAPKGDLVLIVGKEQDWIRVHSVILRDASPAFAALIGPHLEGDNRLQEANGVRAEIELPEVTYAAMLILCRALHSACRPGETFKPEELYDLALISLEYQVVGAISMFMATWVQDATVNAACSSLWQLLLASHMVQDAKAFQGCSQQLLLKYPRSFSAYATMGIRKSGPVRLWLAFALEDARNETRRFLTQHILSRAKNVVGYGNEKVHRKTLQLLSSDNAPVSLRSFDLNSLDGIATNIRNAQENPKTRGGRDGEACALYYDIAGNAMADLRASLKGLCLHCYRTGGSQTIWEHTCAAA